MQILTAALKEHGVSPDFVSHVLPCYWEDKLSLERTSYLRACAIIARVLGLDLKSLLQDQPLPVFKYAAPALYKKQAHKTEEDVEISARVATTVARFAIQGCERPYVPLLNDAKALRRLLLDDGRDWVELDGLLTTCWNRGIPVLSVSKLPGKKMEAMAVAVEGRPVIVVAKAEKFRSRLAFWIAHEMGHIAAGHLDKYSVIPDDKIGRDATEDIEVEANTFALNLLFGRPNPAYKATTDTVYPDALAQAATARGAKDKIDPGAIINNWCYHEWKRRAEAGQPTRECNRAFGTGTQALRNAKDGEDGPDLIRAYARANLEAGQVSRDSLALFQRLTETELVA